MSKKFFEFNIAAPKYKNQVVSLNNINKWLRWSKSKISNDYKNMLNDFYIPEPTEQLRSSWIRFDLYRHNGKVLDSDNLGIIVKWTIDAIKQKGWLEDDNQVTYSIFPSIMDRNLVETEIKVSMFDKFLLTTENSSKIFEFNVAAPKYQKQVVSLNNVNKWLRWHKSKISNDYKNMISDWHIPEPTSEFKDILIEFKLYRHNGRVLDADNIGFIVKWTIDAIKEKGWLEDDNQVIFTVYPSIMDRELNETEIKVTAFQFDSYKVIDD
jgi:Holliday junction resolvase RusA-like endonuclease